MNIYITVILCTCILGLTCAGIGYVFGYLEGRHFGFRHGMFTILKITELAFRRAGLLETLLSVMDKFNKLVDDEEILSIINQNQKNYESD